MLTLLKQGGWGNCNQLFPPSLGRVVGVIAQRNGPPGVSDGLLCASRRHWGTAQCFQGRNSGRNSLPGETSLLASAASWWVYLEKAEPASSQQRTAMRWEAVDTSCRKGDTQIYFFHQQERSNTGTRAQGGCEVSVLRDIQTLTRHSPKQPALSWHCHLQRFGLETSQLYHHRGEQLLESHNSGEVLQQTRMATRPFSLLQISFVKKFHKLFSGEARIGSTCSLLVFIL